MKHSKYGSVLELSLSVSLENQMRKDPLRGNKLSEQESVVLRYASEGLRDKEIADRLHVSEKTIDTYWTRIRQKLGARTRTQAVAIVLRRSFPDGHEPLYGCDDVLLEDGKGFWILDMNGRTVYADETLSEFLGYDIRHLAQLTVGDLVANKQEEDRLLAKVRAAERDGESLISFKKSDGSVVDLAVATCPIYNGSGEQFRTATIVGVPKE